MKCLVVDDEALARERLVRMLGECDGCQVCGEAAGGAQALQQLQRLQPDLVLLDIRMPGMDGMEVARHMLELDRAPAVIFTTAYGDHALEAFETQAVDYLLKPVHPDRLRQALDKAQRMNGGQLERIRAAGGDACRTHLCARSRGNLVLVAVEDIVYLQADSKYVTVCSPDTRILIEESLKSLEQEFADRFIRIHRNALVAGRAIRGLEKDAEGHFRIALDGADERLEVSRRLLPDVRRLIRGGVVSV
ncbi:MAG: LytTR family DNA-binding domain-containing protein [Thiogranum sp.]|jgi:two-component system response regulator AlgR